MKKKLYFIFALLILIIVLIVSCNKINILGANYIPPETDFKLPEEAIPGYIDVNPVPAKEGEVFGGFSKKFKYKDKWYILADYIYDYDPERKKLNKTYKNIILEIDDNANINVYAKNVDYDIFDRLKYNISVIENDRVIYEPSSYGKYSISNISPSSGKIIHSIVYDNIYYTSSDLINWQTNGSDNNIRYKMPYPNPFNFDESFQGGYGTYVSRFFQFKDYIYLIGLVETFYEQNPSGTRPIESGSFTISKDYYYRIHKSKDTSVGANWEKIDKTSWGARSTKFVIGDFDVKIDKNKIYITKGLRGYYKWIKSPYWDYEIESFENDNTIWSTTDGLNWQVEPNSLAYDKANEIDSYLSLGGNLPYIQNRIKTPEEPNWIKLNNGRYYKSDNSYETYIINKKTYYVPIPPYEEIKAAYDSGQEYFTITEEHIKTAGLNQFLTKDKEPNKDEYWTVITPIDYTDNLMVWQSGGEKVLLNINNKVIQFIDYYQIELMIKSPPIESYSTLVNYFRDCEKKYREGFYDPVLGYFVTSIREAMYYGAKADMTEAFMKNYKEYIMPDESLTHYTVEFKY